VAAAFNQLDSVALLLNEPGAPDKSARLQGKKATMCQAAEHLQSQQLLHTQLLPDTSAMHCTLPNNA
jgi:hypothetical protein